MITSSTVFSPDTPFELIQELAFALRSSLEDVGELRSFSLEMAGGSSSLLTIRLSPDESERAPAPEPLPESAPASTQPRRVVAPQDSANRHQIQSLSGLQRFVSSLPKPLVINKLSGNAHKTLLKEWLPAPTTQSQQHLRGKSVRFLEAAGITTVGQLIGKRVSEILDVSGIGGGMVMYLATHLAANGLQFAAE